MQEKLNHSKFQKISTIWQEISERMFKIKRIFNKDTNEL